MITYKKKYRLYKYELQKPYEYQIGIKNSGMNSMYLNLYDNGTLIIEEGYAWDGPSGPTINTKTFMRGSLVHDALYQLIRERLLPMPRRLSRAIADKILYKIIREDGMFWFRAWYVYLFCRLFGWWFVRPRKRTKLIQAP